MRRILPALLIVLLLISAFSPARALDEIQGVTAVWNDFASALRRGDYLNAHGLFSEQSRLAMPYSEFVDEYAPLSAAREIVLAKPDSLATRVDGDWGEINFGGVNPGTGRKFSVVVSFVRNRGGWGLVAARNEARERVEAGARALLRLLRENRAHGAPRDLIAALARAQAENPVFRFYRLETDGSRFTAYPAEGGLRVFFVDERGGVQSVDSSARSRELLNIPQESSIAAQSSGASDSSAARSIPQKDASVMPELSDPGVVSPAPQLDDWEEPPMPSAEQAEPQPRLPGSMPNVTLPDTIR